MALTIGNVQSATFASTGSSITLTKPTGLAEGDLMVAIVGSEDQGRSFSATGWSVLVSERNTSTSTVSLYAFTKVADSSDVAASNFTFTGSGIDDAMAGILTYVRSDSTGPVVGPANNDHNRASNGGGTLTLQVSINPSAGSALFFAYVRGTDLGTTANLPSIPNSNPTWTERLDTATTLGNDGSMRIWSAVRSAAGDTGNVTHETGAGNEEFSGFLFAIEESSSFTPKTMLF